jgi:Raf kinase inhibitor-like YbhB/YbcL family protein
MLIPAALAVALASCGASDRASNQVEGGSAMENATIAKISLASDAFQDGRPIPAEYTCDGSNRSPPLTWSEPPQGTKSFALVIDDPDAPSGTFRHWGLFNILASTRSIDAGQSAGTSVVNDFGNPGYGGPCPPKGHGPHHYHFKLFALDVDQLSVGANARVIDVENESNRHAIAKGELVGTYERR